MFTVSVQLRAEHPASFTGHRVSSSFLCELELSSPDSQNGHSRIVPARIETWMENGSEVVIELPNKDQIKSDVQFRVIAPDGMELAGRQISPKDLEASLTIPIQPKSYPPIERNTDPAFGKPAKLRGRVIDAAGRLPAAGKQVVIWGQLSSPPQAPFHALAVTRTDAQGYFFAAYPISKFAAAHGVVGIGKGTEVPILLNPDGTSPERVILAVDLAELGAEASAGKCACDGEVPRLPDVEDLAMASATFKADLGTGSCVEITKPNRTIEEFEFHSVVRTTEPVIKGLTLTPAPKIGAKDIVTLLNPKLFAALAGEEFFKTSTTQASFRSAPQPTGNGSRNQPERAAAKMATTLSDPDQLLQINEVATRWADWAARRNEAGNGSGPASAAGKEPDMSAVLDRVEIDAGLAKTLAADPDGFSLTKLASAELATNAKSLLQSLDWITKKVPGRTSLTCGNPIDWDDEPTFYQACTISHGHILRFKQIWQADGYSLGDLLYSLPLAPCQKKQLVVLDWERREFTGRQESLEAHEAMEASLSRDRDISEIASASLKESLRGGSEGETSSYSLGLGHAGSAGASLGGILSLGAGITGGISFGGGEASSSAWQKSSRQASADSLQQLRDRTIQAASAVRGQRSTVVQSVRQGERFSIETEVVANHNHCHAITIEYFEVLRHFLVKHDLVSVQECLFVPMFMSRFDSAKALRWREPLSRFLRDRRLRGGFDALQRISNDYVGSDLPTGSYADEEFEYLDGFLRLRFRLVRPADDEDGNYLQANWSPIDLLLGINSQEFWEAQLQESRQRDRIFLQTLGPKLAEEIANGRQ
jgi:hypothetical protein